MILNKWHSLFAEVAVIILYNDPGESRCYIGVMIGPKTVSMAACAALKSLQIRLISQSITRTFVLGSVASRHGIYFPPSSRHYKAVMSSQNII